MGEPTYFAFFAVSIAAVTRQCEAPSARNLAFAALALLLFTATRFEAWAVALSVSAAPLVVRWSRGESLRPLRADLLLPVAALSFPLSWLAASEVRFGAWNFSLKAFSDLHQSLLSGTPTEELLRRVVEAHSVGTMALLAGGLAGCAWVGARLWRARGTEDGPPPAATVAALGFGAALALYVWTIASRTMVFPHERFATAVAFAALPIAVHAMGEAWARWKALRPAMLAAGVALAAGAVPSWRDRPATPFPFDVLPALRAERTLAPAPRASWTLTVMPEGTFDSLPNLLMATDLDRVPLFWQARLNAAGTAHEPLALPLRIEPPPVLVLADWPGQGPAQLWLHCENGDSGSTATLSLEPPGIEGATLYTRQGGTRSHGVYRRSTS
jgi:hypothetical protein